MHGDSCFGCAGRDVCEAEVTLNEERWCGGATDDRPGLDSDRQSGVELWGAVAEDTSDVICFSWYL